MDRVEVTVRAAVRPPTVSAGGVLSQRSCSFVLACSTRSFSYLPMLNIQCSKLTRLSVSAPLQTNTELKSMLTHVPTLSCSSSLFSSLVTAGLSQIQILNWFCLCRVRIPSSSLSSFIYLPSLSLLQGLGSSELPGGGEPPGEGCRLRSEQVNDRRHLHSSRWSQVPHQVDRTRESGLQQVLH